MQESYEITKNDDQRRIDRILRKLLPELSLGMIYKYLRKGFIKLNGHKTEPNIKVAVGDKLLVKLPIQREAVTGDEDAAPKIVPDLVSYRNTFNKFLKPLILYENEHILAINKPKGLLVHGKKSMDELVNAYLSEKIEPSLSFKPGPVNRLDRNTTGLILFSCSLEGARIFTEVFRKHSCEKYYLALCDGVINEPALWENKIDRDDEAKVSFTSDQPEAKTAVTKVIPIFAGKKSTLVLFKLFTGRTHQIRVQAASAGHSLTGDKKYGGSQILPGYVLHSAALKLKEPSALVNFQTLIAPLSAATETTIKNILNPLASKRAYAVLNDILYKKNRKR